MRTTVAAAVLVVSCLLAGCTRGNGDDSEPPPDPGSWPPPHGIGARQCVGISDGDPCSGLDEGWCKNCETMSGCYCDGARYECHQAFSLCDFGLDATCAYEGTPACDTPPAPAYCTCTDVASDQIACEYTCPFPECPDYDATTSACTCAGGTCP